MEREKGWGFGGRTCGDKCAQCLLACGMGFPQLCMALLTNTHCLSRENGWENGKVRAVSPALLNSSVVSVANVSVANVSFKRIKLFSERSKRDHFMD